VKRSTMSRKPMTSKGSRTKGGVGEREVVALLQEAGFARARRNFMSGGQGGGDIIGVPDTHIEVKRCERVSIWDWIGQAEGDCRQTDLPMVAFRRSHSKWYGVLPFEDLIALLAEVIELRSAL
jgi:hypothetical protein